MTSATCGLCTAPTRNHAYLCDPCGDTLATDLKDLHDWLDDDLETSVTGAKGVRFDKIGRTTGGNVETGLRVNWRAAELYRRLHAALVDTVDHCVKANTTHTSPSKDEPARTIPTMALWLTWRIDALCLDPKAPTLVRTITDLVASARKVVEWQPPERRFLGPCEICGQGHVYAEGDDLEALCNRCEAAFAADLRRASLLAELDDQLLRAVDIAKLSTYLGLRDNRDRVQQCIHDWHRRGRIVARGADKRGDPTYRWGDVYPMILERERRHAG